MTARGVPPVDLARVCFYVDEDLAGLGLGLMRLRSDLVVASHPPIDGVMPRDDLDWIPAVAARGWVAITNDRHIRTGPWEAQTAIDAGLRCVHLAPPERNATRWHFARLLLRHWDAVEGLVERSGPIWLQLDRRAMPYERSYQPGAVPSVPSAPRPRPAGRAVPAAPKEQDPPQDPLPFRK